MQMVVSASINHFLGGKLRSELFKILLLSNLSCNRNNLFLPIYTLYEYSREFRVERHCNSDDAVPASV